MGVTTARHMTEIEQVTSPGGQHVAELVTPAVPAGRDNGYIVYRPASISVFGCTCGAYTEGTGTQPREDFDAHLASPDFQGGT